MHTGVRVCAIGRHENKVTISVKVVSLYCVDIGDEKVRCKFESNFDPAVIEYRCVITCPRDSQRQSDNRSAKISEI